MGKPNIVLIVLDSVRADHLGCYGYERETSPNMDRMADEGLKFERCYANSFCSVPSHSSLFTGKLPSEHRMFQYLDPYFDQENRLVKGLKSKGYYTYGNSNNIYINSRYGFDRDFDEFDHQMWASDIGNDNTRELINDIQSTGWNSRKEKYLGAFKKTLKNPQALLRMASLKFERKWGRKYGLVDQGAKKSLKSIEKKFTERSPLFVFTNLMEAHAPYMVPLTFKRKFSSRRTPKEGVTNAQGNPTDEELEERINLYDDCIRYLDNKLGDFIDKVEKKHSETVFIITADHGELFLDNRLEFEDRKQGHTASSSDGILKVPLIIYGDFEPEKFDPEKPISLRDLGGIVESLADDQGFESSGLAISENLWSKGVCSKTITDGENRVVVTENDIHYIGEKKKCEMLEKSLRESTETFEKIDSLMEERNLADDIDI